MDLQILTTVFCFISLVLGFTALTALSNLKAKVNAHLDRTDLHTEKLKTILSILQQIEAKQDLMFNNAPPVPGEDVPEQSVDEIVTLDLPSSLPYCKSPMPDGVIPVQCMPKIRKARKDAGVKRGPYKKATAQ